MNTAAMPATSNGLSPNGISMVPDSAALSEVVAENTEGLDLSRTALLVKLTINQYSPKKKSDLVAQEAAERHNADPQSLEGRARIIAKDALAEVTAAVSKARTAFAFYTVPWDDSGYRLLPSKMYPKLMAILRDSENHFIDAVDRLVARRDALEAEARTSLNEEIFNEVGFPSESEMRDGYGFKCDQMPLTNPKDIRLSHVSQEQIEAIQRGVQARFDAKAQSGVGEIVERMMALVKRVAENCEADKPRIYDTLIGNIREACEILPDLNMTDNPEIARLIVRLQERLTGFEVEQLRSDPTVRKQAASAANGLLDDLRNFGL